MEITPREIALIVILITFVFFLAIAIQKARKLYKELEEVKGKLKK